MLKRTAWWRLMTEAAKSTGGTGPADAEPRESPPRGERFRRPELRRFPTARGSGSRPVAQRRQDAAQVAVGVVAILGRLRARIANRRDQAGAGRVAWALPPPRESDCERLLNRVTRRLTVATDSREHDFEPCVAAAVEMLKGLLNWIHPPIHPPIERRAPESVYRQLRGKGSLECRL